MPIRPPRNQARSKRDGLLHHWSLWIWFPLAMLMTLGGVVLWKSGRWLVHEDSFEKVPWALVLAGESRDCERTDAAIKLYHEGRIDTIVLSACRIFKTHYQSEYMVDYVASQGVPRGRIFEFRQDTFSTLEEARLLVRQFRLQNLDTVLIITSNYHTARTRRIFRKLAQGFPQVLVYPAEFPTYNPAAWWSNRESMKYWFNEWVKTFETYIELAGSGPENGKAEFQNLYPDIWSDKTGNRGLPSSSSLADSSLLKTGPIPKVDSAISPAGSGAAVGSQSASGASTTVNQATDSSAKAGKEEHPAQSPDSGTTKSKSDSVHAAVVPAKAAETKISESKAAAKDSAKKAIATPPTKRPFPKAEPAPKAGSPKAGSSKTATKKTVEKTKKKSP